jgi:branched-chain amino acid transport system ATP-binding protein
MPPLKVHDVQVSYGKVRALRGVTLSVDEREIVSIVGANGAGKSTISR